MTEQTTTQTRLGDTQAFGIDDAQVIKRGQITIPKDKRELYDLDEGDFIDVEIYVNGTSIMANDVKIGESGRVTIPARQRERYDIDVGDRVDIGVFSE